MNVTLIGMAGAGKSYLGKRLAARLNSAFLDIDTVLEEIHGMELEKVVETMGDEKFIEAERDAIISATSDKDAHVFSPGGSCIYAPEAMEHLAKISRIIFLRVPFETIQKRIGSSPERMGRIVGIGKKSFRELYDDRSSLYEKYAHHTIETEKLSAEESVRAIVGLLNDPAR